MALRWHLRAKLSRSVRAFGKHHARTLRMWNERILAQRTRVAGPGYIKALLHCCLSHLEGSAAFFATGRSDGVHIQLPHSGRAL